MKIYFDENIPPNLAKGLHILELPNKQGFEVLSIEDVFGKGAKDEDWIPKIGEDQGIVITHDLNINRKVNQRKLLEKHGVGIFFIKPPNKKIGYKYWELVEYTITRWKEITNLVMITNKPFSFVCPCRGKIYKISI
ncbi:MAG: hypothetical protein HW421_1374 [Ignavibacteria bacterium]|nr:hypothetical protein [Ignavibacteria bacterium]